MAKILFAYRRDDRNTEGAIRWQKTTKALDKTFALNQQYSPSSLTLREEGNYLYIFNPVSECIIRKDFHLCIGSMTNPEGKWWEGERAVNTPLTIINKQDNILIYADLLGSRTLWFYQDSSLFLASTSQRAMVVYLQSFEWNPQAAIWMLATGCTGPGYAWDKRFRALGAGGALRFNKRNWELEHHNKPVLFSSGAKDNRLLKKKMVDTLTNSIGTINIDLSSFFLTLSGGYDSRAALYYLKNKITHTMSWGLQTALKDPETDAYIAQKLAEHLQTRHHFLETDRKGYAFESVVDNFICAGEGRVDHIQTHTDGLAMWSRVAEKGIRGVIRADEVFGWLPVQNELDTRLSVAFNFLDDFANLKPAQHYDLEPQEIPSFYQRRRKESIENWRDRLYQQYRITYIQTGLHELVYPFVELVNPLLLDEIVAITHTLPVTSRTSKQLYSEIIEELVPSIPFATKPAIPEVEYIVKEPSVTQMIKEEIESTNAQHCLSIRMVKAIVPNLKTSEYAAYQVESDWKIRMKSLLPFRVKKLLRRSILRYELDYNQLAFRNYLILKVNQKYSADSLALGKYE